MAIPDHDTQDEKAVKIPSADKMVDEPEQTKAQARRAVLKDPKRKWMDPDNEALWTGEKE